MMTDTPDRSAESVADAILICHVNHTFKCTCGIDSITSYANQVANLMLEKAKGVHMDNCPDCGFNYGKSKGIPPCYELETLRQLKEPTNE